MSNDLTRPIVGIENRTAQEVFDIMCDRIRRARPSPTGEKVEAVPVAWQRAYPDGEWAMDVSFDPDRAAEWQSWGIPYRAFYSTATVATLVAERDEAREVIAKGIAAQDHLVEMAADWKARATAAESALAAANARVERLELALTKLVAAFDHARMVPARGVGGMTIEANIKNSVYHGVPAWPVEEARAALTGGENA